MYATDCYQNRVLLDSALQLTWNIWCWMHHTITITSAPSCDAATRRALLREHAQFDSRLSPVHLTQPRDPQKKQHTHTPKKKTLFIYMEGSQLAPSPHHETLARAAGASRACRSWHQFPPLKLCKGPAVTQGGSILGWSAWVPRERLEIILTGWTQFLPIPAFQRSSYFWVMLFTAAGTAERNTTQLEENGGNDTSDTVWGPAARERC